MKVLQVINSLSTGGAEKLILDIVPLFQQRGVEMDVLCLSDNKSLFMDELKTKTNGEVFALSDGSVYNPLHIFKIMSYLRRYDIIHVHLFPSLYFVVLAKILSLSQAKLMFTEHSTYNRRLSNPNCKLIEKFIYSFYKRIICITSDVKNVLIDKLSINADNLAIVENGVDIDKAIKATKADRSQFDFSDDDKLLIMVAGFREEKDQDTIIRAIGELPKEYKLVLVGDGARRNVLEKLVTELDLKNRVNFLGNRSDVYSLMKMADIAILSSHWEGFGLVAVESMACGIPLIASNVEGLAQVVEGGGILFEKGDVEDLKRKIFSLEDASYYREIREKGIAKAKQYDIMNLINKTLLIYKDVVGG